MHTLTLHIELSIDNTLINLPKKQLITETMLIWQISMLVCGVGSRQRASLLCRSLLRKFNQNKKYNKKKHRLLYISCSYFFSFWVLHSPNASTPGGLMGAVLRVDVLLGVGASAWDVGVLDLDTGVVDFSFWDKKQSQVISITRQPESILNSRFIFCPETLFKPITIVFLNHFFFIFTKPLNIEHYSEKEWRWNGHHYPEWLTRLISLDLDDGVLLEEAMEEGLSGASFFSRRRLSKPFSRGEWAGLPLGDDGSCGGLTSREGFFFIFLLAPQHQTPACKTPPYLVGDVHHQIVVTLLSVAFLQQTQR